MDNKEILENYAKGLASGGKMRGTYIRIAREFLDYVSGDFTRDAVTKWMNHLRRKYHYSDGSINFAFRVVRTLYKRNEKELEWPFRRGESPRIREGQIQAPALDPDVIREMIETVKVGSHSDEAAFLALSSTYGLRREEMIAITPDFLRLKDRTIEIATLKHGRERTHLVPEEIMPYLEAYDFSKSFSEFAIMSVWYRLEYRIRLPHIDQVGWHSIRRTLNTLLLDKLPENTVMSFLRWKQRTSSHMPFRYSAQRYVGREGIATRVVGEAKDVDEKVFARDAEGIRIHPFLDYWR